MPISKYQLDRLERCEKDELGQPLVCYGCRWAAAPNAYTPETLWPGQPVEWMCLHCIRNPNREEFWQKYSKEQRADAQTHRQLMKDPLDLFCPLDLDQQRKIWDL